MAIEIVDFPMKNGGSFHSKLLVYQRVYVFLTFSLFRWKPFPFDWHENP